MYRAGTAQPTQRPVRPVRVDRAGREAEIDPSCPYTPGFNGGLSLSPDGTRLAMALSMATRWATSGSRTSTAVRSAGSPSTTRSSTGRSGCGTGRPSAISPRTGNRAPSSASGGGGGAVDTVVTSLNTIAEAAWSADDSWLAYPITMRTGTSTPCGRGSIPRGSRWWRPPGTMSGPRPFLPTASGWRTSRMSRDATRSTFGPFRILPRAGGRCRWRAAASRSGPTAAASCSTARSRGRWCRSPNHRPTLTVGAERVLFADTTYLEAPSYRGYDVSRDDQSFIMLRVLPETAAAPTGQLVFVENWYTALQGEDGEEVARAPWPADTQESDSSPAVPPANVGVREPGLRHAPE